MNDPAKYLMRYIADEWKFDIELWNSMSTYVFIISNSVIITKIWD